MANVLDTLILMLKTEGAEQAAKDVASTSAKMDDAERSAKNLSVDLKKLAVQFTAAIAPILAFRKAINIANDMSKVGFDMWLLGSRAGISADKVSQLGQALKTYGGDAASASAVMANLNQSLQDMRMGKGGALQEAALLYGLDMRGSGPQGLATADELLESIAKRMETLNTQEQINFGEMMGLDPAMLLMVRGGLDNLRKSLADAENHKVMSKNDIEMMRKFQNSVIDMKAHVGQAAMVFARLMIPAMEGVMKALARIGEFLTEHKDLAVALGIALTAALGAVSVGGLVKVISGLTALRAAFLAARVAAAGGGAVAGGTAALLGGPLVWATLAAIAAVAFAIYRITNAVKKLKGENGGNEREIVQGGRVAFSDTRTPIAAVQSGSVSRATEQQYAGSKPSMGNISFQGGINITTAATDSKGIAASIRPELLRQLQQIANANASGALA